jgi:hypothetical protein
MLLARKPLRLWTNKFVEASRSGRSWCPFRRILGSKITYNGRPSGMQAPNRRLEALLRTRLPGVGVKVAFSCLDGKLDLCQHIHRTSRQDSKCRMRCGAGSRPVSSLLSLISSCPISTPCMYRYTRSRELKELGTVMNHCDVD